MKRELRSRGGVISSVGGARAVGLAVALAFGLVLARGANAADVSVNVSTTQGLLDAFTRADANPQNQYTLTLAKGTYNLPSPLKLTKGYVVLNGSKDGSAVRDYVLHGQDRTRVFEIRGAAGFEPYLELTGVVVTNGYSAFYQGAGLFLTDGRAVLRYAYVERNRANSQGSGLYVARSTLYMNQCLVRFNDNLQFSSGGTSHTASGGGMAVNSGGSVTIEASTIHNNRAARGGGVAVLGTGTVNLKNSTVSSNVAIKRGGGIFLATTAGQGFGFNTIAFNRVSGANHTADEGQYGGGLAIAGGPIPGFYFVGNILAQNSVAFPEKFMNPGTPTYGFDGHDCLHAGTTVTGKALHGNIVGIIDNCSMLGSPAYAGIGTAQNPIAAKLGTLTGNPYAPNVSQSRLPTHMPLSGSPALHGFDSADANGNTTSESCFSFDQRVIDRKGYPRFCDVGAVEASTKMFVATEDTYGRDGNFAATNCNIATSCGSSTPQELEVKNTNGYARQAFLRFSGVPAGTASLATLHLCTVDNADFEAPGTSRTINVAGLPSNAWGEWSLTWNNRPLQAGQNTVAKSLSAGGICVDLDVKAFVNARLSAGYSTIDFRITDVSGRRTPFHNREAGKLQPSLTVTY